MDVASKLRAGKFFRYWYSTCIGARPKESLNYGNEERQGRK